MGGDGSASTRLGDSASHAEGGARVAQARREFERLWRLGSPPDIKAFLADLGPLSAGDLAELALIDQHERWRIGERRTFEEIFCDFPALAAEEGISLDLIYNEFLIRERLGEAPTLEEYIGRAPAHADGLRKQMELHAALGAPGGDLTGESTLVEPLAAAQTMAGPLVDAVKAMEAVERFAVAELPSMLGRYEVTAPLGHGGMGYVYTARDTLLDRMVALKTVRCVEQGFDVTLRRFFREARAVASLNHVGICAIHDVGVVDSIPFFTMPLVKGGTLAEQIRREGPFPEEAATRIACLVAEALAAAHKAGVIHRDVKPSNVLLNDDGRPVVIDFGLARNHSAGESHLTGSGGVLGTVAYASPEQLHGNAEAIGASADVYGLGVVLYEMLTGRVPFQGSPMEVMTQVLRDDPPPPSTFRPDLSPLLEGVCLKAMSKDPSARYASMREMSDAMGHAGDSTVGGAPKGTLNRPLGAVATKARSGLKGRNRARRALLLALLMTLAGGGYAAYLYSAGGDPPWGRGTAATGSLWKGTFSFRKPFSDYRGEARLLVSERMGENFRGVYTTELGKYEWKVEGLIKGGDVSWEFVEAVRDNPAQSLVGAANVTGTLNGNKMRLVFTIRGTTSVADMELTRSSQ